MSGKITIPTARTHEVRSKDSEDLLHSALNIHISYLFLIYNFGNLKEEFGSSNISLYPSLMRKRSGYPNIISTSLALFLTSCYFYIFNIIFFLNSLEYKYVFWPSQLLDDKITLHFLYVTELNLILLSSRSESVQSKKSWILLKMKIDCIMCCKIAWFSKSLWASLTFYTGRQTG